MPKSQTRPANSVKTARPEKVKLSKKSKNTTADPEASAKSGNDAPYVDLARPELLKQLVHNDEEVRTKAFNAVKQLLKTKRTVSEDDFMKLWKGLWYTMWHSDTPLVQQALAADLASLFSVVSPKNFAAFVSAFWKIFAREWSTLDKWRLNKYYMLVRLVLAALLTRLAASDWDAKSIADFTETMTNPEFGPVSFGNSKVPHSLRLHVVDVYVGELAKAFGERVPEKMVVEALLEPMTSQLEYSEFKHVKRRVQEEVMEDENLVEWGIVEPQPENNDEEDEDSEFEGFD